MSGRHDRTQSTPPLRLLRGDGPLIKVGHRGAAALAPANTIEAVEAALEHGVDMVELDVFSGRAGRLVLGHSQKELGTEPVTLDDMLSFLAERAPKTGLLADLKLAGREEKLVEALRAHGLVERALACTNDGTTLAELRRLEPRLARSRTYPRGRVYLGRRRTSVPVAGPLLWAMKRALPHRVEHLAGEVGAAAMTLSRRVVTRAAVERCHELGVAVFVWTVNSRALVQRLDELGTDGIISDDPRVFSD
jgi:glycerophosphoryl diester phosphodiesterase